MSWDSIFKAAAFAAGPIVSTLNYAGDRLRSGLLDPVINCRPVIKFTSGLKEWIDGESFSLAIFSDQDPIAFQAALFAICQNQSVLQSSRKLTTNGQDENGRMNIQLGYGDSYLETTFLLKDIGLRKFYMNINRTRLSHTGDVATEKLEIKICNVEALSAEEQKLANCGKNTLDVLRMLMDHWIVVYHTSLNGKIQIMSLTSQHQWYPMDSPLKYRPFSTLILEAEMKERLLDVVERVHETADKGVDTQGTCLFYGKTGNGKTTIIQCMATELKLKADPQCRHGRGNLYVIDLAHPGLSDTILVRLIDEVPAGNVVVIEDVDEIHKAMRPNSLSEAGLTNMLQGLRPVCNGKVIALTSNYADSLSERLVRDGRVNLKLEIKQPTNPQIQEFINNHFAYERARGELKSVKAPILEESTRELARETIRITEGPWSMSSLETLMRTCHREQKKRMPAEISHTILPLPPSSLPSSSSMPLSSTSIPRSSPSIPPSSPSMPRSSPSKPPPHLFGNSGVFGKLF